MPAIECTHGFGYLCETIRGPDYIWGLEVTGLKTFVTAQKEHPTVNGEYTHWVASDVPEGTLFTIGEFEGGMELAQLSRYYVCEVVAGDRRQEKARYGDGWIEGNYRIVANGYSPLRAARLSEWWNKRSSPKTVAFAEHCNHHIKEWRSKKLPPMDEPIVQNQKTARLINIDPILDNWVEVAASNRQLSSDEIVEEALRLYFKHFIP